MSAQDERDKAITVMLQSVMWPADVPRVLRAVAESWAPDGEYTADDLRALADQVEPGGEWYDRHMDSAS